MLLQLDLYDYVLAGAVTATMAATRSQHQHFALQTCATAYRNTWRASASFPAAAGKSLITDRRDRYGCRGSIPRGVKGRGDISTFTLVCAIMQYNVPQIFLDANTKQLMQIQHASFHPIRKWTGRLFATDVDFETIPLMQPTVTLDERKQ